LQLCQDVLLLGFELRYPLPGRYDVVTRLLLFGWWQRCLGPTVFRRIAPPVELALCLGLRLGRLGSVFAIDENDIERTFSERSGMQVVRAIGGRAPLHLTSVGKLFLAVDEPQRIRAYAARTGLHGHTKNSITRVEELERELAKVRQYGYANDNEELELGVRCMAAGIYDDQNKLIGGLSISAPSGRMDESWLPKLRDAAQSISATLGHQPHGRALYS
jgi:DNA-binding IclR family transcriptional regulator